MSFTSKLNNAATFIYNRFANKPGDLLLYTGTLGWMLSSAGQIFGVAINNKVSKEQKRFLIPQEIADAAINIFSFFVITKSVTAFGEHLTKSGRIASKELRNRLKKINKDILVCTKGFNITDLDQMKELIEDPTSKEMIANPLFDKKFQKAYYDIADGVSFISSTIGSIISCNFVTPYLRNKFGANRQRAYIAEENNNKTEIFKATSPVLPAQNMITLDDYRARVMSMPNGSIKI